MDYEEKLKLAKEALDSGSYDKETIEYIFPELKESEDEKILKHLKAVIKEYDMWTERGLSMNDVLAWLEKQGEPKEINPSEFDSQLNRLLGQFKSLPKEELASSLSFYLNVVQNDGTYKEEKQGEQETLCDKCRKAQPSHSCQDITALGRCALEKQGEQKPAVIIPKFKVGDIIRHKEQRFTCKIISVDTEYRLSGCNGNHLPFDSQDAYELVEQKPAEWSIFDYRTWQYIISDVLTKKEGIGQYLDSGECKKIAKYMQEEWSKKLCSVQHPAEWGEEDEERYESCLQKLGTGNPEQPETINSKWFKEHVYSQNTWRPSAKQIYSLDRVLCFYGKDTAVYDSVKELLEQLKKL